MTRYFGTLYLLECKNSTSTFLFLHSKSVASLKATAKPGLILDAGVHGLGVSRVAVIRLAVADDALGLAKREIWVRGQLSTRTYF